MVSYYLADHLPVLGTSGKSMSPVSCFPFKTDFLGRSISSAHKVEQIRRLCVFHSHGSVLLPYQPHPTDKNYLFGRFPGTERQCNRFNPATVFHGRLTAHCHVQASVRRSWNKHVKNGPPFWKSPVGSVCSFLWFVWTRSDIVENGPLISKFPHRIHSQIISMITNKKWQK